MSALRALSLAALALAMGCAAPRRPPHRAEPGETFPAPRAAQPETPVEPHAASNAPPAPASASRSSATAPAGPGAEDPIVATYRDRRVRASELGLWFFRTHRAEAFASLSKLIGSEIVEREARNMGLEYPEAERETARTAILASLREDAAVTYGLGTTPEKYVGLRWRQGLDEHVADRLRQERERWIFSRVIRYQARLLDRAELAVIVVRDEALARDLADKIAQGADFERLAREHSAHETRKDGGRMPPLPREAFQPQVAEAAFALPEGGVSGVLAVEDGAGRRQFELVRLIRRHPGEQVAWPEARDGIEAGLRDRPVDVFEWSAWFLSLERLYGVVLSDNL